MLLWGVSRQAGGVGKDHFSYMEKNGARTFKKPPHGQLRSVELFAGAGGLALGLKRSGLEPALLVDSDPQACETLRKNGRHPRRHTAGWDVKEADVRSLEYSDLGPVALVSAGAPCQPFSNGGLRRGERDTRNMFDEVLRAIRQLEPKAFVIENVRGLLFPSNKRYFDYLVAQLRAPAIERKRYVDRKTHLKVLGDLPETDKRYRVYWRLLNAADFGLPQNRVRLVVVGMRSDQSAWTWPEPTHSRDALVAALHRDEYWERHKVGRSVRQRVRKELPPYKPADTTGPWRTLRDLTRRLGPPHEQDSNGDPSHVFVPGARTYSKHTGSRLDWPAKTVKAGVHGCPGGEHILMEDSGSHRYLTVRECAMLQGFPQTYALPSVRSQAMRQIGNAVPVNLAEALGKTLVEVLGDA